MAPQPPEVIVRVAGAGDVGAIASLRALWSAGGEDEPDFEGRMAAWLAAEGDRRTIWLATLGDSPAGMASVLEYRRMPRPGRPDSRWGYVGNMLLYRRAGFIVPGDAAGDDRLLVRPRRST